MIEFENSLVVGGDFDVAGSTLSPGIARWDGRSWHEMGSGLEARLDAGVLCFTIYAGTLIAGGGFTRSGDTQLRGVARWSGTRWEPLGSGLDGDVVDLAVFRGDLIAAWNPDGPGDGRLEIARWDGRGWTRIAGGGWYAGTCPRSEHHLAVFDDQLYAAGVVVGLESVLGRWDGEQWWPVTDGPQGCNVCSLEALDDKLYVASTCGHTALSCFDGQEWTRVGGNELPWGGAIASMTLHEGKLVLGGSFRTPLTLDRWYDNYKGWFASVVRWDGSRWERLDAWRANVLTLASFNGELYAGGEFEHVDGVPFHHLAKWTRTGWRPVGTGNGLDSYESSFGPRVRAFVEYGGELVAAGFFTRAGDAAAFSIARFDGGTWRPFGAGIQGTVNALVVYAGELVAGGLFEQAGGIVAKNVAAWDGSRWRNLGPGLAQVNCLTVHDGTLLAATNGGVKRWDGSRWVWLSLQSMAEPNNLVSHRGSLYVTPLPTFSSQFLGTVARWNGTSWEEIGGIPRVTSLVPLGDGLLASTCRGVFFWDGSTWTRWDVGSSTSVGLLALHDGALFAMGITPLVDRSFSLHSWDGSSWRTAGPGLDGPVDAIASCAGRLFLGGNFTRAGGIPSAAIAQWKGSAPPVIAPMAAGGLDGATLQEPAVTGARTALLAVSESGKGLRLEYDLAAGASPVQFRIYDVRGRLVLARTDNDRTSGRHVLHWDLREAATHRVAHGFYFLQMLCADAVVDTRRFSLLR